MLEFSPLDGLVTQIQEFLLHDGRTSWVHIFREAIQVVDALANFGLSMDNGFMFETAPQNTDNIECLNAIKYLKVVK